MEHVNPIGIYSKEDLRILHDDNEEKKFVFASMILLLLGTESAILV